jgi:putative oxidoreductase
MNNKVTFYIERFSSIGTAVILLQTLFYKFTAAEESVYIFSMLHMEPWGRIIIGILELITGSLLVFRKTSIYGSLLGLGIITGAIFSHLFVLGIVVQGDGGKLFTLAILAFIGCIITLSFRFNEAKNIAVKFIRSGVKK